MNTKFGLGRECTVCPDAAPVAPRAVTDMAPAITSRLVARMVSLYILLPLRRPFQPLG